MNDYGCLVNEKALRGKYMIITENVTFAYNKNEILSDISFIAPTGKITYLAGVNGAGKTTWIKCATTLLKPKRGAILFDGKTFDNVRKEFAICFDTPPIYKHMSCVDNLQVLYEVDYKKDEVREMAEAIGLHGHDILQPAGKLSYGQRHRLGILGALSRGAKYLILDEPDLGLDSFAVDYVYKKQSDRFSTPQIYLSTPKPRKWGRKYIK